MFAYIVRRILQSVGVMLAVALVPVHAQSPQPPPGKASAGQGGFVPVDAPSNAQAAMAAPRRQAAGMAPGPLLIAIGVSAIGFGPLV